MRRVVGWIVVCAGLGAAVEAQEEPGPGEGLSWSDLLATDSTFRLE